MPSPDFSQYIDLRINDKQPDEIYDEAVDYARLALPEFSPRAGTVEDALLQASSVIAAVNLSNINRLPDGLMEGILKYVGIDRKEATFGEVVLNFELAENGLTISKDTVVVFETTDGDILVQYPFSTNSLVTAGENSASVSVTARSLVAGILPNIPSGTELTLGESSNDIISVATSSLVIQGARAETEVEYFNRGTTFLESMSSTLTTALQVERYILSTYPEVYRCKVYDLTRAAHFEANDDALNGFKTGTTATINTSNSFISLANEFASNLFLIVSDDFYGDTALLGTIPTGVYAGASAGSSSVVYTDVVSASGFHGPIDVVSLTSIELGNQGDSPGYFMIATCDSVGNPIPASTKASIQEDVSDKITAGLDFFIMDAYPADINLTVTISVSSGSNETAVAQALSEELESYISLANWPEWNTTLRIFDIVVRASSVAGVAYVFSVTPTIPTYQSGVVRANNQLLFTAVNDGTNLIGYTINHLGVLPRATVEVVVI